MCPERLWNNLPKVLKNRPKELPKKDLLEIWNIFKKCKESTDIWPIWPQKGRQRLQKVAQTVINRPIWSHWLPHRYHYVGIIISQTLVLLSSKLHQHCLVGSYLPTYLLTYLPTYSPTYLLTYLITYLPKSPLMFLQSHSQESTFSLFAFHI